MRDSEKASFIGECTDYFNALYKGEYRVYVFGEGPIPSDIMLIGEAPGEQESLAGRPFVGKAGANLTEFLNSVSISRESIYITNVVKFRPVKRSDRTGQAVNRPPTSEESLLWTPWLIREINLVKPKVIATLGNVPLRALAGRKSVIGEAHGEWAQLGEPLAKPAWLYPLYHPASVIYNRNLAEVYRQDIERFAQTMHDKLEN